MTSADLWTFSGLALSFQPALDAGEAEEVSAAQSGQSVFACGRPRLEADGAGVAFGLLAVRRLDGRWGFRDQLQMELMTVKATRIPNNKGRVQLLKLHKNVS